jgi:hypothetical protein
VPVRGMEVHLVPHAEQVPAYLFSRLEARVGTSSTRVVAKATPAACSPIIDQCFDGSANGLSDSEPRGSG